MWWEKTRRYNYSDTRAWYFIFSAETWIKKKEKNVLLLDIAITFYNICFFFLLSTGTIKTLDSANASSGSESKTTISGVITTSTSSSSSGQTSAGKITTLADLIADVNDSTSWEGVGKKMGCTSEGGTQSEGGSSGVPVNKPVIVLPSLAVRTPRSVPSTQSSTVASTSPGGGTVVIMPTKPVISMGTKRTAKAPRSRKSTKSKLTPPEQDSNTRKPGVSLLTGEIKSGVNASVGTSVASGSTANPTVFSSGSSITTTVGAARTPTMSTSSTGKIFFFLLASFYTFRASMLFSNLL